MHTCIAPESLRQRVVADNCPKSPPGNDKFEGPNRTGLTLVARVCQSLHQTTYQALRLIRVYAEGHTVILEGGVPSYYLKQVAQEAVLTVPGVQHLRNHLRVIRPR